MFPAFMWGTCGSRSHPTFSQFSGCSHRGVAFGGWAIAHLLPGERPLPAAGASRGGRRGAGAAWSCRLIVDRDGVRVKKRCGVSLTIPAEPDRERAGRVTRQWFEVCSDRLVGEFGEVVRSTPQDRLVFVAERPDEIKAQVGTVVDPPDGDQGESREWDVVYSAVAWEELLGRVERLPDLGSWEASTYWAAGPVLSVAMARRGGSVELVSSIGDAEAADSRRLLAAVREVAEVSAPVAVAFAEQWNPMVTPLEQALSRYAVGVEEAGIVLRNYGWLTILSDEMAERVGGFARLRDSGAFVEAERLAQGSCWLLATQTWAEYGPEHADRLFELFAPVLPPGKPQLREFSSIVMGEPPEWHVLPNFVAERDPRG